MNYPLLSDYIEAIKASEDNFEKLKNLRPVLGADGEPVFSSGNFAVVFKMKDEQTGKLHAVKCFLREQEGRAEAYRQIAEELEYVSSTFLTPIKYIDKELFVDTNVSDDTEFPVLLMDWVEGDTLDKYIRKHLDDQYELSLLAYQFSRLAMWLMPQPFAHGDLKPDNILVKSDGTLVLVDYDGMYVPTMKGQRARELGSPDFRHPSRIETEFDEHIDDFSLASILLSLKAISLQPSLLEEYGASDRLLFSERDYRNLSESEALNALRPLMQDAELASLYSLFILAASQNNLSQVSFRLFNLSRPKESENCEYRKKYGMTKDEYLKLNFNEVKTLTAVCQKNVYDFYVHEEYPELEVGKTYQVSHIGVFRSSTSIMLSGFGNKEYKAVCFEICENGESIDKKYTREYRFWAPYLRELHKEVHQESSSFDRMEINLSTEVTEDDLANAWTDEYGVKYSKDRKRLLKAPQYIEEYIVRKGTLVICDEAFSEAFGYTSLQSIIISDTVVRIGNGAFRDCEHLSNIKLSRSLLFIGEKSFSGCKGLYEIDLPNSVIHIGERTFYECESLTKINIPNALTKIEGEVFRGCAFPNISIPDSVKSIGFFAFGGCESLSKIDIPDSVVNIGDGAFSDCGSLEQLTIPKRMKEIGKEVFRGCGLTEIFIPTSVVKIGNRAFWDCNLSSITIPDSVKTIEAGAFYGCPLLSVTIPNSISKIEDETFCDCFDLKEVIIPDSVKEICDDVFCNCLSLSSINLPNSIIKLGNNTFSGCNRIEEITIPGSVTSIGDFAFSGCDWLEEVTFLGDIPQLGSSIFSGCDNLLYINVINKNCGVLFSSYTIREIGENIYSTKVTDKNLTKAWVDDCGVKYSQDGKRLLKAPSNLINYTVREGTIVICDYAFSRCEKLSSIVIPNSVIEIGESSFSDCYNLHSIRIPESVLSIGESAFLMCSNLQKINIPIKLKSIGANLFKFCPQLSSINIPDDIEAIGYGSFWGCRRLSSITIPQKVSLISESAFRFCEKLASIRINSCDIKIAPEAFYCCNQITSVIIPNGYKEKYEKLLPEYKDKLVEQDDDEKLSTEVTDEDLANAWTDEHGVMYSADKRRLLLLPEETCDPSFRTGGTFYTDIIIKDGTKIICDYSFENCRSLESITIPNSVVKIGKSAFHGCERLKTIIIPNALKEIGDRAFNGCSNLTSINLPAGIKKIGTHLFAGCDLSSISVDKKNAFFDSRDNCNAIIETRSNTLIYGCTSSIITSNISTIGDYAFENVKLNSIIIPIGVKTIGAFAFSRHVPHSNPLSRLEKLRFGNKLSSEYKKIKIPESVNKIGIGAFQGYGDFSIEVDPQNSYYDSRNHCNAIIETKSNTLVVGCSSTIIPAGITKIDSYAFCKCIDLESIRLPQGLEFIGDEAFKDCEKLLSMVIPNSVVSIGKGAFWNCEWLQSVSLSNHIRTIENSLFQGCARLQSISIPESVSTIGDNAFEYCQDLKNVELPNSIKTIGNSAFSGCNGITSILLPPSVTNIGRYAFCNCCLSSILIPENVKKIEQGAFACYGLSSIVVDNRNKFYDSRNNCNAIIDSDTNVLITGCSGTEIPDSVLAIGNSAFYGCYELTHVTIPINIKKLDEYAFDACANLETIEFLGRLDNIGTNIFDGDSGVPTIIIPEGTRMKYEELFPDYKARICERVFLDNHKGLKRPFSEEEIKCVTKAGVVNGKNTKQVCFYLTDGSQKYIPLSKESKLSIGDEVVLNKAKLIEFNDEGICYGYIDGRIYYSKNIVDA